MMNQDNTSCRENIQSDVLDNQFCWAIVGAPGSGKTTFIERMLSQKDAYKNKFDYIFVISPSNLNIAGIDPECTTNRFKIDWIYERLNYLK